jgi:hypothetical protein
MKKFCINGQWRNKLFFIVSISLVKAAMNAPAFGKCAKIVLPALISAQWCYQNDSFLCFPIAKGGTKTIAHYPVAEFSPPHLIWLPNCKL